MHDLADHDVVRITRRIVPAEHDRVGPARDIRRLCARVRNGPGHRDRAAAAGRGRGGYASDEEVRMGPRGAGNGNVLRIVAVRVLRRIFLRYHGAVIVISVGNDGHHQGTGCGRRVGQQQAHATRQCCTGCQPCGWRIGRHYQAGERYPGLDVVDRYAVAPAANRCERAAVDVRPSERELPTRLGRRCGIDGQVGHDQIRRGQHVQLRPVFCPGRFDYLVQCIDRDNEAEKPACIRASRPREAALPRGRRTGCQRGPGRLHDGDGGDLPARRLVQHDQLLRPAAQTGCGGAGVGRGPGDRDHLAGQVAATRRCHHGAGLQVWIAGDGRSDGEAGGVVAEPCAGRVALRQGVVHVCCDTHLQHTGTSRTRGQQD